VKGTDTPVVYFFISQGSVDSRGDNLVSLGSASNRWTEVYAANGTINTSDERQKEQIEGLSDKVLDAWANVEKKRYKWISSVETKGDKARWHVGVIAQDVQRAFEDEGLDPFEWAILCFDSWEEQVIEHPSHTETIPAGERYGVRYDQAAQLDAALERRERLKLEAKIELLLSK